MSAAAVWALCATGALAQTDIEFIQWWEPEMPAGALRGIMDDFEAENPDIKVTLVSGPYSATHDQIVVGAASGTLSDVVGLDGAWVNGLAKQGAIASMDPLMDAAGYDRSQIADIIKVDGKSVMFPLASFVYPGLRQPRPRQGRRRREHADQPHRVRRSREEDDRRRQEPVRLGAAAVAGNPERHPERRDVVGLGVRRRRC